MTRYPTLRCPFADCRIDLSFLTEPPFAPPGRLVWAQWAKHVAVVHGVSFGRVDFTSDEPHGVNVNGAIVG